jgi:hypothetical protein
LCWILLLGEYGVTFEYLLGKKNVGTVADALSHLEIYILKIQEEEEVLTLLSGSENSSIRNIKLTILMHTALIFKEQAKVKGLRERALSQPRYSIQHIEGYDHLCYKQDLHSSTIETDNKDYCFSTMNIYFIQDRLEQSRKTIRNTMTYPGLTQDVED